ncbi:MAG: XisI protein [Stigonema ocellatum SAG 48.90 = DSM 106950]|nr:XisI protein [Stigonema ocellatum SAG 48.90 = DSM 106950]
MNRVEQYTQIVQQTIHDLYNLYLQMQDAQTFCIVDPASRHYQVIQTGWDSRHRRIYTSLHLSIQDEKVYVHSDPTEEGIANILIEKGIPQWDIVLEYQAPELRQYTSFAQC